MWALEWEISKEKSEHLRFREPHCHSALPVYGNHANIRTNFIFLEIRITDVHFPAHSSFFSSGLHNTIFFRKSAFRPFKVIQGH